MNVALIPEDDSEYPFKFETLTEGTDLIPLIPAKTLLLEHAETMRRLREQLALPPSMEPELLFSVIERGAAYYHRFPASETNHHFEAGGLLKHSLEVSLLTLLLGEEHLYDANRLPSLRKSREVGWRYALFIAGWLHDVGKLVNGLRVWETNTGTHWNPYRESILAWGKRLGIKGYRYSWRPGRGMGHTRLNPLLIEALIGPQALGYLIEQGADVVQALTDALVGVDEETEIRPYLIKADCKSAGLDFRSLSRHSFKSKGYALDQQIVTAMRRTFLSQRWSINQQRSLIWHIDGELFLLWPEAGQEIIRMEHITEECGVPSDPNALADLFLEFGIAKYQSMKDGEDLRFWKIQPETHDKPMQLLKLASVSILFEGAIPWPLKTRSIQPEALTPFQDLTQRPIPTAERNATLDSQDLMDAEAFESPDETHMGEDHSPCVITRTQNPALALISHQTNLDAIQEWLARSMASGLQLTMTRDGRGFLPHPETAKRLGYEPKEVLKLLNDAGWILTDPSMPLKRVMTYGGERGVFIRPDAARYISEALKVNNDVAI